MALPSSGPLDIETIRIALGGERNLGYYRGRTYYRGGTPVVISQNPSISEFYGLSNVPPLNSFNMYQWTLQAPNPNAFVQWRYYPNTGDLAIHNSNGVLMPAGPWVLGRFNPALYTNFQFNYAVQAGCCVSYFGVAEGMQSAPDGRCILQWNLPQGSDINIIATVTATPI